MNNLINFVYLITAFLLILGLRYMSSPKTAKQGITLAGWAMLIAIIATFFVPSLHGWINYNLMIIGIIGGTFIGWYSGKKVLMINMPQMIALYNGMGGGAAAAIAALELTRSEASLMLRFLAVLGAIIGAISFSGSIIAFAKLQDLIKRVLILPKHQFVNSSLLGTTFLLGLCIVFSPSGFIITPFFFLLLILGVTFTIPIGGANMPIVISLFNAMTGLAVGFNGFVLNNAALIIAGTVVGASGTLLTQLMAKAMNKSVVSILFATSNSQQNATGNIESSGSLKPIEQNDAGVMMAYSNKVIIVPGYGMAVAQAQHKVWELAKNLEERGVNVKFAIHPVAGRMPGHMNVLLAEAGVPYEKLFDLEEINADFPTTDTVLIIGANDVVNPSARNEPNSPIFGMPILDASSARNILIIKRGQGKGFSGVENSLFTMDNSRMLYGDGQEVINKLIQAIKMI